MPPNPRDNLRAHQQVPIERVRDVIADSLAAMLYGDPHYRDELAALAVERLAYFKLLAPDVDISHCSHDVHVTPHVGCILR